MEFKGYILGKCKECGKIGYGIDVSYMESEHELRSEIFSVKNNYKLEFSETPPKVEPCECVINLINQCKVN